MIQSRGHSGESRRGEDASTLLLFPAALLILIGLAALILDSAGAYLAQRRLADLAAAAALDAVQMLDLDHFYATGEITVDRTRAATRAEGLRLRLAEDRGLSSTACVFDFSGADVTIVCEGSYRRVMVPSWIPLDDDVVLRAVETARAVER